MFIIELTTYESEFIEKKTKLSGADEIRTFDINHKASIFVYYFSDHVRIDIKKYEQAQSTLLDWLPLKNCTCLLDNIDFSFPLQVCINEDSNLLEVYLSYNKVKRNDQ